MFRGYLTHIFVVKLAFSTHGRMFNESVDVLLAIKYVSNWGGLETQIFGFIPNALTTWAIRARHLLAHVFESASISYVWDTLNSYIGVITSYLGYAYL